eukprot:6481898-Amphidinium_carterae.2
MNIKRSLSHSVRSNVPSWLLWALAQNRNSEPASNKDAQGDAIRYHKATTSTCQGQNQTKRTNRMHWATQHVNGVFCCLYCQEVGGKESEDSKSLREAKAGHV